MCRNEYLQTMFAFLGSAEKAGSGVDKILWGWESASWRRPYIEERPRPTKVILTLPLTSLLDETTESFLWQQYGDRITAIPQEQLLTLSIVATEEETTNERLQYALNLHRADITKMLRQMCEQQLFVAHGRGKGTRYRLFGMEKACVETQKMVEVTLKTPTRFGPDRNKREEDGNKRTEDSNSPAEDSNRGLEDSNRCTEDSNSGEEDGNQCACSAAEKRSPVTADEDKKRERYGKGELRGRIWEFCSEDWRTAEEVAGFVLYCAP